MDRRGLLFAMGAAAVSANALPGIGQDMPHHHMGGAKHQALIDTASACSSAADIAWAIALRCWLVEIRRWQSAR